MMHVPVPIPGQGPSFPLRLARQLFWCVAMVVSVALVPYIDPWGGRVSRDYLAGLFFGMMTQWFLKGRQ